MIKLYNFDELKPEEILNRDIRAEKNVRGYGGRRHWTPRPSRNRRTDGSSTDASRTSSNRDRAGRVPRPQRS